MQFLGQQLMFSYCRRVRLRDMCGKRVEQLIFFELFNFCKYTDRIEIAPLYSGGLRTGSEIVFLFCKAAIKYKSWCKLQVHYVQNLLLGTHFTKHLGNVTGTLGCRTGRWVKFFC